MKAFTLKGKDKLWTTWKGRLYALPLPGRARSSNNASGVQDLVAPYSCKVLKVLVKDGQAVKVGDPVIVIEAMKMEYNFTSPKDGTIKKVLVESGKIVSAGTVFVEWA